MKRRTKTILSYILSAAVILISAVWVGHKFIRIGRVEFTDNARICQQVVPINNRVQGYIKEIRFNEFEPVHKGDTLVLIDEADMCLTVVQALADYQMAVAGSEVARKGVETATASEQVSEASMTEAKVLRDMAAIDNARYKTLWEQGAVAQREYDAFRTDYEAKQARYEILARQKEAASATVETNRSLVGQSEAATLLAKARLEEAELHLSYCVVLAPCDGYASRKEIQKGQLVQPGQTLLEIVDMGDIWITANYKETQLKHIQPGSEVEIAVDAVQDVTFYGKVASISTATGSFISLLQQDNSSGNFVKVRQRVPIHIVFSKNNPPKAMKQLRAGMNVECKVRYGHGCVN